MRSKELVLRLGASETGEQQAVAAGAVAKQIRCPVIAPKPLKLVLRQRDPIGFSRGVALVGRRTAVDLVQAQHRAAAPAPPERPPAPVLVDPADPVERATVAAVPRADFSQPVE